LEYAPCQHCLQVAYADIRSPPWRTLHQKILERETGIEPATNSLEGCDSTTELLPPFNQLSAFSLQLSAPFSSRLAPIQSKSLEPMTRIELVTSPLPRECSTN